MIFPVSRAVFSTVVARGFVGWFGMRRMDVGGISFFMFMDFLCAGGWMDGWLCAFFIILKMVSVSVQSRRFSFPASWLLPVSVNFLALLRFVF